MKRIVEMQKVFRDLDSENLEPRHPQPRMTCYYSLLSTPENKLVSTNFPHPLASVKSHSNFLISGPNTSCQGISPHCAILPGVKAIAPDTHHFEMTRVNEPQDREIIELPRRVSQEALKRRWIETSQKYHGEERSQASVTTPILKRDKIFSLAPKEEKRESAEEEEPTPPTGEGDTDTKRLSGTSSLKWIYEGQARWLSESLVNKLDKRASPSLSLLETDYMSVTSC